MGSGNTDWLHDFINQNPNPTINPLPIEIQERLHNDPYGKGVAKPTNEKEADKYYKQQAQQINSLALQKQQLAQRKAKEAADLNATLDAQVTDLYGEGLDEQQHIQAREALRSQHQKEFQQEQQKKIDAIPNDVFKHKADMGALQAKTNYYKNHPISPTTAKVINAGTAGLLTPTFTKNGLFQGDIDTGDFFDDKGNPTPQFKQQVYEYAGGDPNKFRTVADAIVSGRIKEYEQAPSAFADFVQHVNQKAHDNPVTRPLSYLMQAGGEAVKGLAQIGAAGASIIEAPFVKQPFGESLSEKNQVINKTFGETTPENETGVFDKLAGEGSRAIGRYILPGMAEIPGIGVLGESALFNNGTKRLANAATSDAERAAFTEVTGKMAIPELANSGMNKLAAQGYNALQYLSGSRAIKFLDNTVGFFKGAGAQVYSGYYDQLKEQGYSPEEASNKAWKRTFINAIAMGGLRNFIEVANPSAKGIVAKALGEVENKTSNALLRYGTAGAKNAAFGGAEGFSASIADSWQNFQDAKERGELSPDESFPWQQALEDAKHGATVNALLGGIIGTVNRHGVVPRDPQANAIATALNDPKSFKQQLYRSAAKGEITPEQVQTAEGFMATIAPHYEQALVNKMKPDLAAKHAVESARLDETNKQLQFINDELAKSENYTQTGVTGKKVVHNAALDERGIYTEDAYNKLLKKKADLESKAAASQKTLTQLKSGTYVKDRTITGAEMKTIIQDHTPEPLKQAKDIGDNGPYRAETVELKQFEKDPDVQRYAVMMRNPEETTAYLDKLKSLTDERDELRDKYKGKTDEATGAELKKGSEPTEEDGKRINEINKEISSLRDNYPLFKDADKIMSFKPQGEVPPVLDNKGDIIDGKKRIAYNLVGGAKDMEVVRPLGNKETDQQVKNGLDEVVGSDQPNYEGLDEAKREHLQAAAEAYNKHADDAPKGFTAAASELINRKVSKRAAVELLRRLSNDNISPAQAEQYYNSVKNGTRKVNVPTESDTTLTGVKFSDIFIGDKGLEDILDAHELSEPERGIVREIFARGIKYFDFNEKEMQGFRDKFINPEDINDVFDAIGSLDVARESAYGDYNTRNYEHVKDGINYILNNEKEYPQKIIGAIKEIHALLDNPTTINNRLYAIDIERLFKTKEKTGAAMLDEIIGEGKRITSNDGQSYANIPRMKRLVSIGDRIRNSLPPVEDGFVRLYRGNRSDEIGVNPQFTKSLEGIAIPFKAKYGGDLSYVDVPKEVAEQSVQKNGAAQDSEFILPEQWYKQAKVIPDAMPQNEIKELFPNSIKPKENPQQLIDDIERRRNEELSSVKRDDISDFVRRYESIDYGDQSEANANKVLALAKDIFSSPYKKLFEGFGIKSPEDLYSFMGTRRGEAADAWDALRKKQSASPDIDAINKKYDNEINKIKNAVPIEETAGVLPREQGETGTPGSEREGVGSGEQGIEPAEPSTKEPVGEETPITADEAIKKYKDRIIRNDRGEVERVLAPDGSESSLYKMLLGYLDVRKVNASRGHAQHASDYDYELIKELYDIADLPKNPEGKLINKERLKLVDLYADFLNSGVDLNEVLSLKGNKKEFERFVKGERRALDHKDMALKMWASVYTEPFKKWYGDWQNDPKNASKTLRNGEPMLFYHMSPNVFDSFNKEKAGETTKAKFSKSGLFFTEMKDFKPDFQHLGDQEYIFFLKMKAPDALGDTIDTTHKSEKDAKRDLEDKAADWIEEHTKKEVNDNGDPYDGVIIEFLKKNEEGKTVLRSKEYVVFEPNQVKSIYNSGKFDSNSDNFYDRSTVIAPQSEPSRVFFEQAGMERSGTIIGEDKGQVKIKGDNGRTYTIPKDEVRDKPTASIENVKKEIIKSAIKQASEGGSLPDKIAPILKDALDNKIVSDQQVKDILEEAAKVGEDKGAIKDFPEKTDLILSEDEPTHIEQAAIPIPFAREFVEHDVKPLAQRIGATTKDTLSKLVKVLNPRSGVSESALTTIMKTLGSRNMAINEVNKVMDGMQKVFDKMPQEESVAFIDRMKKGEPQPSEQLQEISDTIKELDKDLYDEIAKYKPNIPWKENHFRVLWKTIPGEQKTKLWSNLLRRPFQGSKGFLKKSTLADMSSGIERGGEPTTYNPVKMFKLAYADGMKFITAQRMMDALKADGLAKFIKPSEEVPEGYTRLNDNIANVYFKPETGGMVKAGEYYVEDGSARILNNYLSRDYLRESKLGKGLMEIKNLYTQAELGFSAFHAVAEGLETISSQIGIGLRKMINLGDFKGGIKDIATSVTSPGTTFKEGRQAIRFASEKGFEESDFGKRFLERVPAAKQYIKDFFEAGGLIKQHDELQANAISAFKESINKKNYIGAGLRSVPALSEMLTSPLFNTYIPALKVGMFFKEYPVALAEQKARIDKGLTTEAEVARKTVDFIDDRLGEMNFDNLFWNRTFKSGMQLMFRSVTWRLGTLRALAGAPIDQAKEFYSAAKESRAPMLNQKMGWLLGLSVLQVAFATILQKLATGDSPDSFKDLIAPKIGSDDKDRVVLPTYIKDAIHITHDPTGYLKSGMSGPISRTLDIWANKDFYNYEIYDPHASLPEKLQDQALYFLPKPFSVTSAMQMATRGDEPQKQALSFFGINHAPGYLTNTPIQNEIFDLYSTRNAGIKPKDARKGNEAKTEIRRLYRDGKKEEAEDLINQKIEEGTLRPPQTKNLMAGTGDDPTIYFFKRLPFEDKKYLFEKMTDEEKSVYDPNGTFANQINR